jgi:hypothetical protein
MFRLTNNKGFGFPVGNRNFLCAGYHVSS